MMEYRECYEKAKQANEEGRFEEALHYLFIGLERAQDAENSSMYSRFLVLIGYVLEQLGDHGRALDCYLRSLAIKEDRGYDVDANHYGDIGQTHKTLGLYEQAIHYFKKSIDVHEEEGSQQGLRRGLINLGVAYSRLGQYDLAFSCYERVIQSKGSDSLGSDLPGTVSILVEIGNTFLTLGEIERGLYFLQHLALGLYSSGGAFMPDVLPSFRNVTNLPLEYLNLGQETRSNLHNSPVFRVKPHVDSLEDLSIIHSISGIFSYYAPKGFLDDWGPSLSLKLADRESEFLAMSLNSFKSSREAATKSDDALGKAYALSNLGAFHHFSGQYQKAARYFQEAVTLFGQFGDSEQAVVCLTYQGCALMCLGETELALFRLEEAARIFEDTRLQIDTGFRRSTFQRMMPNIYGLLAQSHISENRPKSAFETIERGRAKVLLEDLANSRSSPKQSENGLISAIQDQRQQLDHLRSFRHELTLLGDSSHRRAKITELNQKIDSDMAEYLHTLDSVRAASQRSVKLLKVDPPTLEEVQSYLPPECVLIEYCHPSDIMVGGNCLDQLWIFVVTASDFRFETVTIPRLQLESTLNDFAKLVSNPLSDQDSCEKEARKLYQYLLQPVEGYLNHKTIIIVPHGSMFKVPFGALMSEDGPIVEHKDLVIVPSAAIYRYMAEDSNDDPYLLALGNPTDDLPGAEHEVKAIAKLFPKHDIRLGSTAIKEVLYIQSGDLEKPSIVHFACHGEFDERTPALSHLLLAPSCSDDGKLHMQEILAFDWEKIKLATVSACSSGRGDVGPGDDIVGFVSAFLIAGADSVLASLWNVDDEATQNLMIKFYDNYLKGNGKAEALRQAQMSILSDQRWRHPYYWSSFSLWGHWQ